MRWPVLVLMLVVMAVPLPVPVPVLGASYHLINDILAANAPKRGTA